MRFNRVIIHNMNHYLLSGKPTKPACKIPSLAHNI